MMYSGFPVVRGRLVHSLSSVGRPRRPATVLIRDGSSRRRLAAARKSCCCGMGSILLLEGPPLKGGVLDHRWEVVPAREEVVIEVRAPAIVVLQVIQEVDASLEPISATEPHSRREEHDL